MPRRLLLALVLCAGCTSPAQMPMSDSPPRGAASRGASADWVDLFDGETLAGWHGIGQTAAPSAWRVTDGAIHLVPGDGDGGDLVADGTYGDFELELEWKVAPCGNSGVFYRGAEQEGQEIYASAPEYQVLDDACHPDARFPSHRAGSVYDLYTATPGAVRAGGEWNEARIVARGGHVEHWLNGIQAAAAEIGSADWQARLAASKFRDPADFPGFGSYAAGVIAVQDHGDEVWYRHVRIRPL